MIPSNPVRSIHLSGEEFQAFWNAVETAIRGMDRDLNNGLEHGYDEDAGVVATRLPNPPHMTHLLLLGFHSMQGLFRIMDNRVLIGRAKPSSSWMGITVERDAQGDDETTPGATINCESAYLPVFGNILGLLFQYAIVRADAVEVVAAAEVAARIESGDSRACYVPAAEKAEARAQEVALEVERIKATRMASRHVLRRMLNAF